MLMFLPPPLLGAVMGLLVFLNTLFWVIPLYTTVLVKLLLAGRARDAASRLAAWFAQQWAHCNTLMGRHLLRTHWDIHVEAQFDPRGQYLVCANHQSWNDIFVLMTTFGRKAPFFKFFLKQELIWVPLLGLAWWGLDYPFMKRYTREQIEKNPALKGTDLATTRRACERYRNVPAMILNFLEGTRFTKAKHARQQSPYKYLLKPKSGGFAFTLSAMGRQLNSLLDVTIVYPQGAQGFWDFLCGRVHSVKVDVRPIAIPADLFSGDYENDPVFRQRFQTWIGELWSAKDRRIEAMQAAVPH